MDGLFEQLADLPTLLGAHVQLTLVALSAALAISLPLAVGLVRSPRTREPVLAIASVLQTIPSLALLALMVPVFVAIGSLVEPLGVQLSALGFLPAVVALTLYGVLPILRNTVTGIAEVDPKLTDAARGLGMSPRQILVDVELPLAAPVIFAGVRTAAVWIVGTATLATPVGQPCLGNYIFSGLQTRNWTAVLVGVIAAAGLAIALDLGVGLLERSTNGRQRLRRALLLAAVSLAVALTPTVGAALQPSDRPLVVIGAKGFTEQLVLARVVERRLEEAGYRVQLRENLGSTIAFEALKNGEIDVSVDYTGTLWTNHLGREDTVNAGTTWTTLRRWLDDEHQVLGLGRLGFENAYCLAVRADEAQARGWSTIDDLAASASQLRVGADYEFFQRPEWAAVQAAYRLDGATEVTFDATFLYDAIRNGDVEVISAYSSDGRIAAFDLSVLDDPRNALPPYDAVLLVAPGARADPRLVDALEPLVGAIDVETMRTANQRVDSEGDSPGAAAAWLDEQLRGQ